MCFLANKLSSIKLLFYCLKPLILKCVVHNIWFIFNDFFPVLQHYFIDAWNSFDALIVVGSVVDIVVTEFSVSFSFLLLCNQIIDTVP